MLNRAAWSGVLACVLVGCVVGWVSYPWVLDLVVAPEQGAVLSVSVQQAWVQQMLASLSWGVVGGLVAGAGVLFPNRRSWGRIGLLIAVATSAWLVGVLSLKHRANAWGQQASALPDGLAAHLAFPLEIVPVYEPGLMAGAAVLVAALMLWGWERRSRS